MSKFIMFYINHKESFLNIFLFLSILVCLLVGIIAMNTFNSKNEKDLSGKQLFVAMIFLSMVLYNGMAGWANKNLIYVTSLIIGYGSSDILRKWRRKKIWNKFDFIDKGGDKND